MSKLALATRAAATVIRALEFAISAMVLGIFSWYLACMYPSQKILYHLLTIYRSDKSPPTHPNMGEGSRGYVWRGCHLHYFRRHPYLLPRRYYLLRFPRSSP